MPAVTELLEAAASGDRQASDDLLPLVYDELRKLAAARIAAESPGQTLQPTALVHEAYVRLVDVEKGQDWNGRGHFFGAAAEAMRRILVEQARRKQSLRRGGDRVRVQLLDDASGDAVESERILAVHEALTELEAESPRKAQIVKLRYFAGMTLVEAAKALEIAEPTAKRDWAAARVWLHRWLSRE